MATRKKTSEPVSHRKTFRSSAVAALRSDLALALRAAAHHGLGEGVCNHFSVELPDGSGRFLINPRGLHWSEVGGDDIVLIDADGSVLAGRHAVEPTAMFIHGAIHRIAGKACVLHTHMPYSTALTLTVDRGIDTALSQSAMRFHGRVAIDDRYNGLALDAREGERIANAMQGADVAFLGNHGVVVCGARMAHAYDDLYMLERACMTQVIAASTGRPLVPVAPELARQVCEQTLGERMQSELFFEALRRMLPEPA
jgi:ribulose-5-phosphate 4-epimerase/fuculose-1-phosphate aldolase